MRTNEIENVLSQIRRRLWLRGVIRVATVGLAIAAAGALLLVALSMPLPAISLPWAFGVPLTLWLGGVAWAASVRITQDDAAVAVDQYYGMKDRTISALQFAAAGLTDPLQRLQVDDTRLHFRKVRPSDCVPIETPAWARHTAVMFTIATAVLAMYVPSGDGAAVASPPLPQAAAQADQLRATVLSDIERLAEEQEDAELAALSDKLQSLVQQLEQQDVDQRDLVATLSEMEQALADSRDALQLDATDTQLQQVAAAMQPAEALKDAAEAMQKGQYEQAAESLESVDPRSLSDKERRAVADNLKQADETADDKSAADKSSGKIAEATKQVQEGLEKQDPSQAKEGLEKLAEMAKRQSVRKQIDQTMASQLNRLADSKAQARGNQPGNQPGDSDSKSDKASEQWGRGTAGTPNEGPATKLDSQRQREQLEGQQADGPSEKETVQAEPEDSEQQAARAYQKRYQEFHSQAEAVLESEPLPLGHRRTVRQYFEQIRPQASAGEQ